MEQQTQPLLCRPRIFPQPSQQPAISHFYSSCPAPGDLRTKFWGRFAHDRHPIDCQSFLKTHKYGFVWKLGTQKSMGLSSSSIIFPSLPHGLAIVGGMPRFLDTPIPHIIPKLSCKYQRFHILIIHYHYYYYYYHSCYHIIIVPT